MDLKVGLTGGIGSGKTTVARFFEELGVPVYYSDVEAKELMNTAPELKKEIQSLFGPRAYVNQKLNKTFISEQVFNDTSLLKKLNDIVHPAVRSDFLSWAKQQKACYVIQEAAIIFEIGSVGFYHKIILVTAPKAVRVDRIRKRDLNSTEEGIEARMRNQWNDSQKIDASDFVIENLDLEKTKSEVLNVHRALLAVSSV